MKKLGLLGISEGNGHPYSFSAIINGFDDEFLKDAGWDVIYEYVKKRDASECGFNDFYITHVWTQDKTISMSLASSCKIANVVDEYKDLIGQVDAVIIARDDFKSHHQLAKPFLKAGIKVFIDKPLTLDIEELLYFKEYLSTGQLMSMSGMRYAIELDEIRANLDEYGELKLIQSSVINDWEKYGVHMIDAVLGFLQSVPESIEYINSSSDMYILRFKDGLTWTINILGDVPKTFCINVWGTHKRDSFEINDNYSMFRRMLWRFERLVTRNEMHYQPKDILISLCLLIGGQISKKEGRKVLLNEFNHVLN